MKVTVIHDEAGNIARLAANPSEEVSVGFELQSGERLTEVEMPEASLDDKDLAERLSSMINSHRLETEGEGGRLVQRS